MDERAINEMRNLGPVCQRDLNEVGVFTAEELKNLGPREAFMQIANRRLEQGKSLQGLNAIYLYALYGAIHNVDWREVPEELKREFKSISARLRRKR